MDEKQKSSSIIDDLKNLIDTKNPFKFLINLINFYWQIRNFFTENLNNINNILNNLNNSNHMTKIMSELQKNNFHEVLIWYMWDYILDSFYLKDNLYKKAIFYIHKIQIEDFWKIDRDYMLKKQDLTKLNFNKVFNLLKIVERDYVSKREIKNYQIESVSKEEIFELTKKFQISKKNFYNEVENFLNKKNIHWDQKTKSRKLIKTFIIENYYNDTLKCFYWYDATTFLWRDDYENISNWFKWSQSILNSELEYCKTLIVNINNIYFWYIFKPLILLSITNSLWFKTKDTNWLKIKFYFLYMISKDYREYISIFNLLKELEAFSNKEILNILKISWFWIISFPILILAIILFLPLWVFFWIVLLLWKHFYNIISNIKWNIEYKIKFNLWINLIATISILWSLTSSIFLTQWDVYKSWYEKTISIINWLSAMSFADILWWIDKRVFNLDIWSWVNNWIKDWILTYNYIEKWKSYYWNSNEINIDRQIDNISNINDQTNYITWKYESEKSFWILFKSNEFYPLFSWKIQLSWWVYLRDLSEKILLTHNLYLNLWISEEYFPLIIMKSIKDYTKINIDYYKSSTWKKIFDEKDLYYINKIVPVWFEIDLWMLEKVCLNNIEYFLKYWHKQN